MEGTATAKTALPPIPPFLFGLNPREGIVNPASLQRVDYSYGLWGFLLGATTITGVQAGIWFGLSGLVSFAGGIGAYAVETFSHGSDWNWPEAIGSGFMGLAAGIMAYGAGGISKLALTSSRIAGFVVRSGVKFVFTFPLQFTEGSLIDYLS